MNEINIAENNESGCVSILHVKNVTFQWHDIPSVTSTMDYAAELLDNGAAPWTLITAAAQTAGRGTQGRDWLSLDKKGLYLSLILPLPDSVDNLDGLTVATADILIESLVPFTGQLDYAVKLPNDVLIGGKKVAGILYETKIGGGILQSLIFGLGLNCNQCADDFGKADLDEATSLSVEMGRAFDRGAFLRVFLSRYVPMFRSLTGQVQAAGDSEDDMCPS